MQVEQSNQWNDKGRMAIEQYKAHLPRTADNLQISRDGYKICSSESVFGDIDTMIYGLGGIYADDEQTVMDEFEQKNSFSDKNRKNEMVVLANTTSAEDLKEIEEEGFSLSDNSSRTIITVTDKIKAVLAKAGVDISCYGDSLSREELKEITGSDAVANQIMQALDAADLPATDSNIEDCIDALQQVASMDQVSEESMSYLIKNNMDPTIQNIYIAQYSSAGEAVVDPTDSSIDFEALMPQMEQIIESAELPVSEESKENSKWLVANKIPLTAKNLQYLTDLQELSEDLANDTLDWGEVLCNMTQAISEGKRPKQALLITQRRQLEETRLAMTTESSAAMNRRGIEVDTKPLEDLVEELKIQEKAYYQALLGSVDSDTSEIKADTMTITMDYIEEMKSQPSYVLGQIESDDSLQEIHDTGARLQQELAKASASYETLMTTPRKDLGDSIQKAFSNVDDILRDLSLDTTEANRRAVRILGYNQTAVTVENITEVKALDEQMQRTFRNMTPAVTLEMIRHGENPLDMSMEELNTAAESIQREQGYREQERFSKYLYKLEQDNDISEEERSSYIGIYRLIAQVEKSDGAAIGFLNKEGADVTMRNLLQAIRSSKKGQMDYSVSDDFDGMNSIVKGERIDDQIKAGFITRSDIERTDFGYTYTGTNQAQLEAAYQQNCIRDIMDRLSPEKLAALGDDWKDMTPEQLKEALAQIEETANEQNAMENYANEQLENYSKVLDTPQEVYAYLDHYDIPNSMANVLAASEMLRNPNRMMERLFRENISSTSDMEKIAALKQKVLDNFEEALRNPEEMADAQEVLAETAEHVMDDMILEDPNINTHQIRDMRQMVAEFKLCSKRSEEECYMIPIQTGDSVTGVTLRVVRGRKEKGLVDIFLDAGKRGKIAASFQANDEGVSALIAAEDEETAEELSGQQEELAEQIGEECDLHIANVPDLSLSRFELYSAKRAKEDGRESTGEVQTSRLYHIAEVFIQSMCG